MIEIIFLGLGIVGIIVLNMMYMGWRGSVMRKAEAERINPYGNS